MKDTKFTKGPWITIESDGFPENEITTQKRIDGSINLICGIDTIYDGYFGVEQVANAHLIASAPDMYTMLSELSDSFGQQDNSYCVAKSIEIDELLAKARGEMK